jgi:hypothetical protein
MNIVVACSAAGLFFFAATICAFACAEAILTEEQDGHSSGKR